MTLTTQQLPSHHHSTTLKLNTTSPTSSNPAGMFLSGVVATDAVAESFNNTKTGTFAANSFHVSRAGGNQSYDQLQPSIAIYYIIALFGTYPSRS